MSGNYVFQNQMSLPTWYVSEWIPVPVLFPCSLCGQFLIKQSQSWMCSSQGSWSGVWTLQPLAARISWSPHLPTASFLSALEHVQNWQTCKGSQNVKTSSKIHSNKGRTPHHTNSNKSSLQNRGAKHSRSLLDLIFSQQMEADKIVTPILLGS